jgi:nitroimidazol reductase NimA-like FMN-containing flavoprotein (pyridoxamine 5'-phosphate oxidase superfamily)
MRRRDKEITDKKNIEDVILNATVCKLAMCDSRRPYIVPLCFGFKNNTLYFHSAPEGKKIDMLKNNPYVCFEFDIYTQVIKSAKACKWGMKYRSVIGYGKASFITDHDLKRRALDIIMQQYAGESFVYEEALLTSIVIIKVDIESMTGKKSDI